MKAPYAAGILLRTPENRVLLVRRAKGDHAGKWAFPAGKIEDGETPEQAARRETEEETGHLGNDPLVQIDQGDFVTFREDVEEFEPRLNDEHTEHMWAPMDSTPEPMHPGAAATLKKLVARGHALDKREIDANGWFTVYDNPVSKVGVYQYRERSIRKDGDPNKMVGVFRPPEELGNPETVRSFRLQPWTDDHPDDLLGPKERGLVPADEKGVRGVTGEQTYFRDGTLYANIKVFSEALARKIASGKRELSLGYHCQFIPQEGVYEGQPYQYVQRNIRGNHVASVDKGRMGDDVRVLDAAECCLTFALDFKEVLPVADKPDEIESAMDAEACQIARDSWDSLVAKLMKEGKSKEYAEKIAGKVYKEQQASGDSTDKPTDAGTTVSEKGEVKDPSGKSEGAGGEKADLKPETSKPEVKGDAKDRKSARDARDSKRSARDARRAKDEMSEEEEEGMDAEEAAEDAEEEREDERDDSAEARDRRSARDRRMGARDARRRARDRAKDRAKDSKKGMDEAEITALVQRETTKATAQAMSAGRREAHAVERIYQRVSPIIGAFDHDEMTTREVAAYSLKKLGQTQAAESPDPVTALDCYLAASSRASEAVRTRGSAHDSDPSGGADFVSRYLNGASA